MKTTNQQVLEKIAVSRNPDIVRIVAIEKITNQQILENITLSNYSEIVRIAAIWKLTNAVFSA